VDTGKKEQIIQNLSALAIPMDKRDFTSKDYDGLFPRGKTKTPIEELALGKDLFDKLRRKDGGKRQSILGGVYQPLTDPVAVIQEKEGGVISDIYIKSFTKEMNISITTIVSVAKNLNSTKIVVTAYKRKLREVLNKKSQPQSGGVFFFVEEIFCTCGVYYHEF
jgi:hypothetical protein